MLEGTDQVGIQKFILCTHIFMIELSFVPHYLVYVSGVQIVLPLSVIDTLLLSKVL
jgi:hypothetical protein